MFQRALQRQPQPPPPLPKLAAPAPHIESAAATLNAKAAAAEPSTMEPPPSSTCDPSELGASLQLVYHFLISNGLNAAAAVLAAESHMQPVISSIAEQISLPALLRMATASAQDPGRVMSPPPPDDKSAGESILYDTEGQLRAASLQQLVSLWCDPECDQAFERILLLSLPTLAAVADIIAELQSVYASGTRVQRQRVCAVMNKWLVAQPAPTSEVHTAARSLAAVAKRDGLQEAAKALSSTLLQAVRFVPYRAPVPVTAVNIPNSFMEADPNLIARAISYADHSVFARILLPELIDVAWSKVETRREARNMRAVIGRYNTVSSWTISSVLDQRDVAQRVLVIERLITVAVCLRRMNSYSGLGAIVSSLGISALSRLKQTWAAVNPDSMTALAELKDLVSNAKMYKMYRAALAVSQAPTMPLMNVWAQDLTLMCEGNPRVVQGLINWARRSLVAGVLEGVVKFQRVGYDAVPVEVLNMLMRYKRRTGDEITALSKQLEPDG